MKNNLVKIGGFLKNTKNLNSFVKTDGISLGHTPCCNLSRRTIYFADISGKPIKVSYPFNFNGRTIFNKKQFEKALTEHFGLGYIVYVVNSGNAVVLGSPYTKKLVNKKGCCLEYVIISPQVFPPPVTEDYCNCGTFTGTKTTTQYLNLINDNFVNYLLVGSKTLGNSGNQLGFYYVRLGQVILDVFTQSPPNTPINSILQGKGFGHFSCEESISNIDYSPSLLIGGSCNCTTPVIVETVGDLLNSGVDGYVFLTTVLSNPVSIPNVYSITALAYLLTAAQITTLQGLPANTPLIDVDLGIWTPSTPTIEFFRAASCPILDIEVEQ